MFLGGKKLIISLVFISQSYFKVPKTIRINTAHYFFIKTPSRRVICLTLASSNLSDTDFKDFINLYKEYTKEPYSFLVKDAFLSSDNPLRFKKNLL